MDLASSRKQEAGTSSRASGKDKTRGAWRGSDVTQFEIDWLYRSRRIPEGVICRLPGDEIEPVLEPGEVVVFLAHFERGFGLPASDFFRQFLNFYRLQPHHLPGNAVFYLSCFVAFMEGYIGIRPARETFARFFSLRINSVQGKDIPKPKPPVQCGSCIIGSRQGSPFFKFNGLESCRLWQTTFFYVKNEGDVDLINLPAFNPAPPAKTNWQYNPGTDHAETNRVVRFMLRLMKDTNICSDDIIRAFIAGCFPFSSALTRLAKARFPRIDSDRRGPCRKRPLDKYDPDPVIHWLDLRMGRTPSSRLGKSPPEPAGSSDDLTLLEAEVGDEFLDKLMAEGQGSDPPAAGAGPSHAPPAKRPRTEVIGGKQVSTKRYKQKRMPVSSGPALELGSAGSARTSTPPPHSSPVPSGAGNTSASPSGGTTSSGCAAPTPPDHRAEEDFTSPPEAQDTGASNIGAGQTDAGQAEPLATPTPPPSQGPSAAKRTAPSETPKITKFLKPGASRGKAVEGDATGGSRDVVLHVGPAAAAVQDRPTGLLGRIVELNRAGKDLGHLLPYAQKWNEADISASTRGLGKDRLPAPDPAGPRSTEEHFTRLKRAVKEFDSAWYDATNNVVSTADARKQLFEELLWEHRDLAEAHSHCQVVPEATIEALKAQVTKLQGEKEQLLKEHNEALDAQKTALGS
ncbi:hypothetical protein QYE76_056583 [Lolium multiflorum]|uniref:Transposase (putative) gypsy type domain-containing protein n=1 Tax=Lolium multiflorum TaxID=4521 RepID=A0AAD8WMZ0_LOLMU|nr:hypothetical protein QYE76_056583 [Lolium multiflorum]